MTEPEGFPHLFAPARLRGHTLRCRIVFGAHTANMLATTNTVVDALADDGTGVHGIGDTVAARTASMAFYEGRILGMRL